MKLSDKLNKVEIESPLELNIVVGNIWNTIYDVRSVLYIYWISFLDFTVVSRTSKNKHGCEMVELLADDENDHVKKSDVIN